MTTDKAKNIVDGNEKFRDVRHYWVGNKLEYPPVEKPIFNLKIGFIGSSELFHNFEYEANIFLLTESNYTSAIQSCDFDFILMESCFTTCTGDWENAQLSDANGLPELVELIRRSKSNNIPVVYWFTLDSEYYSIFFECAQEASHIFCADLLSIDRFREDEIEAEYLPPAVQPKFFNHLSEYSEEQRKGLNLVSDSLEDILTFKDSYQQFLHRLSYYNFQLYDSLNDVWKSKTQFLEGYKEHILGSVSFLTRQELLKSSEIFISLTPSNKTITTQIRLALEAAASRMPVVHRGVIDDNDPRSLFVLSHEDDDSFFVEIVRMEEDPIYKERLGHKAWRHVMQNHTFSHRIAAISKKLHIECDWTEYPKVSLITPTIRPHLIPWTVDKFDQLLYPDKELMLVFNGNYKEFVRYQQKYEERADIQVFYMPKEKHAGTCMNLGIVKASGIYVFRFDDDDFYGPNYILDYMLYTKIEPIDIIGKCVNYLLTGQEKALRNRKIRNCFYNLKFNFQQFGNENPPPMAGNSYGGKRAIFLEYPYRDSFGTADFGFRHLTLGKIKRRGSNSIRVVMTDRFNLVFWRENNSEHIRKWNAEYCSETTELYIQDVFC